MSRSGPLASPHEGGAAPGGDPDPVAVLRDTPEALWGELLRALRRAVDRIPRAELPSSLRPYAGWTPESLAADRPRAAIARAVAADSRLREEIGEAMEDRQVLDAAADMDGSRLAEAYGERKALAALVVQGRWTDVAVVGAGAAEREARRERSAGEPSPRPSLAELESARRRLARDLSEARDERDAQRRRAEAAEERVRREDAARREQQATIDGLHERVAALEAEIVEERRRRDRRVARLQRRLEEAESRARVDETRAARVVAELERLAAELREALAPAGDEDPPSPALDDDAGGRDGVPRSVTSASPGRPCRLPPGVSDDTADAVRALLQVQGLETVIDGYNVTKDARGRPQVSLADQRRWLVRLCAGVAARYGRRVTVVFDGTDEHPAASPGTRGVRVVFTSGDEIADERIGALVESFPADVPVLVVSSDREVQEAAIARGANSVSSRAFLQAAEA